MAIAKNRKRATVEVGTAADEFPWLALLLVISIVALFFQLYTPAWWGMLGILGAVWWWTISILATVWWTFVAIIDVRNWTWKVYAAVSATAIFVLVGVKAWLDR